MSRIGKQPIPLPDGVEVSVIETTVLVKGPRGELSQEISPLITVKETDKVLLVDRVEESPEARAYHGLYRSLISNMVVGVSDGFSKSLEIVGVGYRAALNGANLELQLGYSHPVLIKAEDGISFEVPAQTQIIVHGIDKQRVGQVAADIRKWRKPEPYKGKGIRYSGERVRRKQGKAAASN
ncbi:MAG: 50S ribosomal protein L6 [Coriobacteriia bacterium]|nr:50S ribosomal protein L6 [Coriobacteriia bacterium]